MSTIPHLDVERVRRDFPYTNVLYDGRPLAYLDSAATSQKPRQVIERMNEYLEQYAANVHRGVYRTAERATREMEEAREKVQRFVNAPSSAEIVFTGGTTGAVNLIVYSWGFKGDLKPGDEIVLSVMEHHSNMVPWFFLRETRGINIKFLDINEDGTLKLEELDRLITPRTRMVAITHCSNVLGTINPVKTVVERAHAVGALCFVDGAQSAPHMPVDVQDIGCDFYALSGHKMLGPTGIGALYARRELLDQMEPFMGGGEMIKSVHQDGAQWNDPPWKFEAGTPNIVGAIGMGAAVDYLQALDMRAVREHEIEIVEYALGRLREIKGVTLYGPPTATNRGGVISFTVDGAHPHDIAQILDSSEGVCVRGGHHCCHPLMDRLGIPATARASFYVYTQQDEIERLVKGIHLVQEMFTR